MITGFMLLKRCDKDKLCLSVLFTIWLFGFILSQISSTRDEIGAGETACEWGLNDICHNPPFPPLGFWTSGRLAFIQLLVWCPLHGTVGILSVLHIPISALSPSLLYLSLHSLFSSLSLCLSFSVSEFGSVFLPFCFSLSQTMDSWQ